MKINNVHKDDSGKERVYIGKLSDGVTITHPAYSTIKKIVVTYGLIRWLKKSEANILSKEQVYDLVKNNYNDGIEAVANEIYCKIFTGTGEDYAEDQRNIGSYIHSLIEQYLSGHEVIIKEDDIRYYAWQQFLLYANSHKIEVVPEGLELKLLSDFHRVGGTVDMVAKIDGVLTIVDWKTSSNIYNDYPIQVACYRALWNYNFPDNKIHNGVIVRIPKTEWTERVDKKTGKTTRYRNKLLVLKLGEKALTRLENLFMMERDIWEYMNITGSFNQLKNWVEENDK